jgi:YHS domain-containing protein
MANIDQLLGRIDAEFSAMKNRVEQKREEFVEQYKGRQQRLESFAKACERLRNVWTPQLEALAAKFGKKAMLSPTVTPSLREATFKFDSQLARIELRFSATTDTEVSKLVLNYDLMIRPILMEYPPHAQAEFPLDKIDEAAVGKWIDDRIVDFVRTYVSLHENEYYLKDFMVEDPVAHVRFPKFAAGAKLESNGKTVYFIGEETRQEYQTLQAAKK